MAGSATQAEEKAAGLTSWPRLVVGPDAWQAAIEGLAEGRFTLSGLWGDEDMVHMALLLEQEGLRIITLPCPEGHFPSVGLKHAPAIRLERTIHDLFGLVPQAARDGRPWLDHGHWDLQYPLGMR